jgi:hypothetical protein
MKSASVKTQSHPLHSLIKSSVKTRKDRRRKQSPGIILPPSEETIHKLNDLGKQYPFCISFKQKRHDPL